MELLNRRIRKLRTARLAAFFSLGLLTAGCAGLVQKGGEFLEGSAFAEMELGLYRSVSRGDGGGAVVEMRELRESGGTWAREITSSEWPGFTLRGEAAGSGGGGFELKEARILSPHIQGWNECVLDISGRAVFDDPKKTGGVLYVEGEPERVQVASGKIRLKSNYLTGDNALASLRNRRERILALTEWMTGYLAGKSETVSFSGRTEFENYWKPVLFPELAARKKRPAEYTEENVRRGRADSVNWNQTYTEIFFPEELREYRNSGALLRDWEEALAWIFIEYSWNTIIRSFNGITLTKIK